jgi:hypothetical protein
MALRAQASRDRQALALGVLGVVTFGVARPY